MLKKKPTKALFSPLQQIFTGIALQVGWHFSTLSMHSMTKTTETTKQTCSARAAE